MIYLFGARKRESLQTCQCHSTHVQVTDNCRSRFSLSTLFRSRFSLVAVTLTCTPLANLRASRRISHFYFWSYCRCAGNDRCTTALHPQLFTWILGSNFSHQACMRSYLSSGNISLVMFLQTKYPCLSLQRNKLICEMLLN